MDGFAWQRFAACAACASVMALAACGGNNENANDTTVVGGDVARTDSAAGAIAPGVGTAGSTATPGTAGSTGTLAITGGDQEILQVLAVVDQGEIQDGKLAQQQAQNARVKSFARELVQDHQRSLTQDKQLAKTVNATLPSTTSGSTSTSGTDTSTAGGTGLSSGVSAQLMTQHTQMMDQVRQLQGAAFDSAFVAAQVNGHQQVLDLLQRAQGQAQNSQVQQHLATATKAVQDHLERAQQLQQSLSSGGTPGTGDSTSRTRSDTARRG